MKFERKPIPDPVLPERRSKSAEDARRRQIEADRALTPLERVYKALSLGRRAKAVREAAAETRRDE